MASRMDRYKDIDASSNSRSKKNKKLYTSIIDNPMYTTISDVRDANTYSIDTTNNEFKTRESYQRIKDYGNIVPQVPTIKKELDDINYLYKERGNKIYDINSVIEEAKKHRENSEIEEEKRKIKDEQYKITKEEIEKYRDEKLNRTVPDKDAMKELINTITSKTLSGELDQATSVDLLSDLMATQEMDRVDKSEEILDLEALAKVKDEMENYSYTEETDEEQLKNMDPSFYTKSMDLSDKDFFEEYDEDEEEKPKITGVLKLFLLILLAALLAVLVYFIIQSF